MAKANSTSPRTPVENGTPAPAAAPALAAELQSDGNPLNWSHERFDKDELPDYYVRTGVNGMHAAFAGIKAIGMIIRANEIEKQSNSGEFALDDSLADGLMQALIFLADRSYLDAEDLGQHLFQLAKGGAQ